MLAKKLSIAAVIACCPLFINAQSNATAEPDDIAVPTSVSDSLATVMDSIGFKAITAQLPEVMFLPAVYTGYDHNLYNEVKKLHTFEAAYDTIPAWLASKIRSRRFSNAFMQHIAMTRPDLVPYNINTMPEPPKKYIAIVDPESAAVTFREVGAMPGPVKADKPTDLATVEINKQHWLNKFNMLLQFQQGYVSPNWYQGGNNSLNLLADFTYQSNLNTKFHPNLMFENNFQWRTALSQTPDDPYRAYSLTENRFQINSKFGYKAFKKWYYSFTGMLKTPVFNGYKSGTETRTASFMSPGELNIGLGMSYNTQSKNGNFKMGLSIAPLSYNLKTVIDPKVSETAHGIEAGHKTKSAYGSNLEMTWEWKICYNVFWKARIFCFTNYDYFQSDWQNQFNFTINRWLSANLFVDMRYDSSVRGVTGWKQFQLREQISLGFSYAINH